MKPEKPEINCKFDLSLWNIVNESISTFPKENSRCYEHSTFSDIIYVFSTVTKGVGS
jgi:hypothetical protein